MINKSKSRSKSYSMKLFYMSLPFVMFSIAFIYIPLFGWVYALYDYKVGLELSQMEFVGFENFRVLFTDGSDFIRVMRNTLVLSFLGILSAPIPVIFAILLNEVKNSKFKRLVQTTTTLPHFISFILVFAMFFSIFSSDGLYNQILKMFGREVPIIGLLGNNDAVWGFHWFINIWKTLGWSAIIYIASIAGIDMQLYEAATVDGCGRFGRMIHVTLPGILPTFTVLFLLQISNILNNGFEHYFVFYNALVADRIEVLDYYIYKVGILSNDYSQATALGIMKSAVSVILLLISNRLSKRIRGESII